MTIALAYGGEILVNTSTLGDQNGNSVAGLSNGNAVVVWNDVGTNRVRFQLLDPLGDRIGGEANAGFDLSPAGQASVTALADGGFVVVWTDGTLGASTVQAQRFDASGAQVGGPITVETTTAADQDQPSVTTLEDGGFVVVWRDNSQTGGDASFSAIRAQKFDASGAMIGGEILVNTTTPGNQSEPHVTALAGGGFAVSWTDSETYDGVNFIGGDGDFDGVRARIFDADGNAAADDFPVNTQTASFQTGPAFAQLSNGNIVAVYTDSSQMVDDSSQEGVLARIFDTDGVEVVAEFQVNTTTLLSQVGASVAALAGGMFLVAWSDFSLSADDASGGAIRAQLFDASGAPIGGEFLVNTTTTNTQVAPSIAVLANGEVLITWDDYSASGGDASGSAVRGQVIRLYESIEGDANINTINGTAGRDAIFGLGNNDVLFGEDGDDHLSGGDASDTLHGGLGADTLDGGASSDTASYATAAAGVTVDLISPHLNTGEATGDRYIAIEDIEGSGFGDTLRGDGVVNVLYGGDGNDLIEGLDNSDYLYGGDGDDVLDGGDGSDYLNGELGNDTLLGGDGTESLYGGEGEDVLDGGASDDDLFGEEDNDILRGGDGVDALSGGLGNDTLDGAAGADNLYGGDGDDILDGGAGGDYLFGGDFPDDGAGDGIDTARYASATAGVTADLGNALNNGGDAAGDLYSLIENLEGSAFHDILRGDDLVNTLTGGLGNDMLVGRGGNDRLVGGNGNDTMNGGDGDDFYFVDNINDVVIAATGAGADRVLATASYALSTSAEIELFTTTDPSLATAIDLTGNNFAQTLIGDAGGNMLNGRGGADTMNGMDGDDFYFVDNSADVVIAALGAGNDRVLTSTSYVLSTSAEIELFTTTNQNLTTAIDLTGNNFAQTLIGNAGSNMLNGKGGADTMNGMAGDDLYFVDNAGDTVIDAAGFGAADRVSTFATYSLAASAEIELFTTNNQSEVTATDLTGNNFGQTIVGNAGSNVLNGKGGSDIMNGSLGADSFVFDTALGAGNVDSIIAYNVADDTIRLENAIFSSIVGTGVLSANQFVSNASGVAQDADDRIVYETDTGKLLYDADGSLGGGSIQFATLNANLALTNADFFVV